MAGVNRKCQRSHLAKTPRWMSRAQERHKPEASGGYFLKLHKYFPFHQYAAQNLLSCSAFFRLASCTPAGQWCRRQHGRSHKSIPGELTRAPGCHPASLAPGSTCLGSLNSLEQDLILSQHLHFLNRSLHSKITSWLITLFHQTFLISKTDLLWLPGHDW